VSTLPGATPREARQPERDSRAKESTPLQWAHRAEPPARPKVRDTKDEEKKKRSRDEVHHCDWHVGQMIGNYVVQKLLGDGTFGRVLEATSNTGRTVALKVIRSVPKYIEAAKIEAQVLKRMRNLGADAGVVQMMESFQDGPLFCLVFQPLGSSLYDVLKQNRYRGFFMADIQQFVHQILLALAQIHKIRLTHTDLKPENVLLVESASTWVEWPRSQNGEQVKRPKKVAIRLIDFGGATFSHEHHTSLINTRQYRAPEVMLGNGWEESSDIWSAACLAAELYTGRMLFSTHETMEHLSMIESIVGPFPAWMCKHATGNGLQYVDGSRLRKPESVLSEASRRSVAACRPVPELVHSRHQPFAKLLRHMLSICPRIRPSARSLCKTEFFSMPLPE
jgi:dual-specificity kinase